MEHQNSERAHHKPTSKEEGGRGGKFIPRNVDSCATTLNSNEAGGFSNKGPYLRSGEYKRVWSDGQRDSQEGVFNKVKRSKGLHPFLGN